MASKNTVNYSHVRSLIFAWAAVTALILTAACSKHDGGGSSDAPKAPPASPLLANASPSPTPAPMGPPATDTLTMDSGKTSPAPQTSASDQDESSHRHSRRNMGRRNTYQIDPSGDMTGDELLQLTADLPPQSQGVKAPFRDAAGNDLFYSGASQDNLRETIAQKLNAKNPGQKERDSQFALRTVLDGYSFEPLTRNLSVTIAINGRHRRIRTFDGIAMTYDRRATQKRDDYTITAACMDREYDCKVLYVQLQHDMGKGLVEEAHMIGRKTGAADHLHDVLGFDKSFNRRADFIFGLFSDSAKGNRDRGLRTLDVMTSETINGESSVTVDMGFQIDREEWQHFGFSGPLVRAQDTDSTSGDNISLAMNKSAPLYTIRGHDVPTPRNAPSIADSVETVRMTTNTGRGAFRVELIVPASAANTARDGAKTDSLELTIGRYNVEVVGLSLN